MAAKYGFLYSAYNDRLPYWETTEMLRKFTIALIPVRPPHAAPRRQRRCGTARCRWWEQGRNARIALASAPPPPRPAPCTARRCLSRRSRWGRCRPTWA